eukprot:11624933-Ditylum_brightwellii.AAC.1
MIAHPSFMESIKARVAAHDNYALVSMPPCKDMRAARMIDGYVNGTHPLAFAARANCADTPNF